MGIVMALYADNLIDPMPSDLAPDSTGHHVFSLLPGKGEMRKYNVSNIERLTYEMLVDILGATCAQRLLQPHLWVLGMGAGAMALPDQG